MSLRLHTFLLCLILLGPLTAKDTSLVGDVQLSLLKNEAGAHLKNREYLQAYTILEKLFKTRSDDVWVNYHLGVCAAALHRYDEAVAAFERALIMEPDHTQARLDLAQVYLLLKMDEDAKREFRILLADPELPAETRSRIDGILTAIGERETRHHFQGLLSLGILYDDNVNNAIGSDSYKVVPDNTLQLPDGIAGDTPRADTIHREQAALTHRYEPSRSSAYQVLSSATLMAYNYVDQEDLSLLFASLQSGVAFGEKEVHGYQAAVNLNRITLGGDPYMDITGALVRYRYAPSAFYRFAFHLRHAQKRYPDLPENDARYEELALTLQSSSGWDIALTGGMETDAEAANINRTTQGIRVGYRHLLGTGLVGQLVASQTQFAYADETLDHTLSLSKRTDLRSQLNAALEYRWSRRVRIQGFVSHITNDSNHLPYQYTKTLAGLTCSWTF